jgi:hypothetical protein
MSKTYSRPVLSGILDVIAILSILGGAACIFGAFMMASQSGAEAYAAFGLGVSLIISALIYLGVSQVIDFLGRTAFHTERMADLMELQAAEKTKAHATAAAPAARVPAAPKAEYFYSTDGSQEGPFSMGEMRVFKSEGIINEMTNVFRTGDKEWLPLKMFPDLMRG